MKAVRIHQHGGPEVLRYEDAPDPKPGPGEVLIRLGAGGICGSDLHYYFEGRNGSFVIREPLVPGHEASGVVAKVGEGVSRVKPGDKIEGWIIAEYPKGIKYGNSLGDMRLSLHAANGWIASQTFPANPRVYDNSLSREWYFAPLDTLITEDQ